MDDITDCPLPLTREEEECLTAHVASRLGLTVGEIVALVHDPTRAPNIMTNLVTRFELEDDEDSDPAGMQLWLRGLLSERAAQWLDGVLD